MTIDDPEAYVNSLWDWGCLDGCFGKTAIHPTDIDGLVERKGHFLFLETKGPGVSLPTGQLRMFRRLIENPRMTVFIVWGKAGDAERIRVLTCDLSRTYYTATTQTLRGLVRYWFANADRNGR